MKRFFAVEGTDFTIIYKMNDGKFLITDEANWNIHIVEDVKEYMENVEYLYNHKEVDIDLTKMWKESPEIDLIMRLFEWDIYNG